MSVDRLTFAVAIVVVASALCAGCGKDAASGDGAKGSDVLAPGATPSQAEIDRIKAQRMPPANLANQRPGMQGGQGGGAPYGAPGGGTTYFKGN